MTTKTFVWQNESGEFVVSCRIECYSQPSEWINSQQEQVIENVEQDIKEALATEYYYVKNGNEILDDCNCSVELGQLYTSGGLYLSEQRAKNFIIEEGLQDAEVLKVKRSVFEIAEKEFNERAKIERKEIAVFEAAKPKTVIKEKVFTAAFKIGATYNHKRFGNGTLISEEDLKVNIRFEDETKSLLKKFVTLTLVEDGNQNS